MRTRQNRVVSRRRLQVAGMLAVLASVPAAHADVLIWTSGSGSGTTTTEGSFAGLYSSQAATQSSAWSFSTNWSRPGGLAGFVPGADDDVIIGESFDSGTPLSEVNRVIKTLTLTASEAFVVDFRQTFANQLRTLQVSSGSVLMNSSNGGGPVRFAGNLLIPSAGTFDIRGSRRLDVWGRLNVLGNLTKTGNSDLTTFSGDFTDSDGVVTGNVNVIDGGLSTANLTILGNIFIGNGDGAKNSAFFQCTSISGDLSKTRSFEDVLVASDGSFYCATTTNVKSLSIAGGELTGGPGAKIVTHEISLSPGANGAAQIGETQVGFYKGYGRLNLQNSGQYTDGKIHLGASQASTIAARSMWAISADDLVIDGTGIFMLDSPDPEVYGDSLNAITTTHINSGTLQIQRAYDPNVLGNTITIGTTTDVNPAKLITNAAGQYAAGTAITIHQNGTFVSYNSTINSMLLIGGSVTSAAAAPNLTLTTASTLVQGSGLTSTLAPTRLILSTATHTLNTDANATLNLNAIVQGTNLIKQGAGTARLLGTADNEFTAITVTTGTLVMSKTPGRNAVPTNIAVGTTGQTSNVPTLRWDADNQVPDNATILFRSGILDLNTKSDTINGINAAGTGTMAISTGAGVLSLAAGIDVSSGATLSATNIGFSGAMAHNLTVVAGSTLNLNGTLSGSAVTINNGGAVTIAGGASNTHASTTIIGSSTVLLNKVAGRNAIGGDLTVGPAGFVVAPPTVRWLAADQVADTTLIKHRGGTIDLNGFSDTVAGIQFSGTNDLFITTGAGTLTLGGSTTMGNGTLAQMNGNFNLGGGTRTFAANGGPAGEAGEINLILKGTLNNGALVKTGVGSIYVNTLTGNAVVDVNAGSMLVGTATLGGIAGGGAVDVDDTLTISSLNATTTTFAGSLTGAGKLVKTGPGKLVLANPTNTLVGGVEFLNGTLELTTTRALGTAAPKFSDFHLLSVNIPGHSAARFTHGASTLSMFTWIDVNDDGLIVDYSGSTPLATYRTLAELARNSSINFGGLGSSLKYADPTRYAVGYGEASTLFGAGGGTWRGQTVDGTTLLFAAALFGDANLDASVNFDDLLILARNYGKSGRAWTQADFDFDGSTSFNDLLALAKTYNSTLPSGAAAEETFGSAFASDLALARSLVPEPTACVALLSVCAIATRRRPARA